MSLIYQKDEMQKLADGSAGGQQRIAEALVTALSKLIEITNVVNTQATMIHSLTARIEALERGPEEVA